MGLSNTKNIVHHGEKKLVGTQEGNQCGDCHEIPEMKIILPGGAGECYK